MMKALAYVLVFILVTPFITAQVISVTFPTKASGVDSSGNLVPDGVIDSGWWIVEAGRYAVVVQTGWPIPPWMANSDKSKWVGPRGDASKGSPSGWITYRTSFELPSGFSNATLTGRLAADNAAQVILNRIKIAETTYEPIARNFAEWTPFTGKGLRAGVNVLEVKVYNWPWPASVPPETANPAGLRVEAVVDLEFACRTCPTCPPVAPEMETWIDRTKVHCSLCSGVVESTWPPRGPVEVRKDGATLRERLDYQVGLPSREIGRPPSGKVAIVLKELVSSGVIIELRYPVPKHAGYTVLGLNPAVCQGRIP